MSAPVSRVFIRHSTIHDSRLSDTAIAVWLWLRRDPRSDTGAAIPLDYRRLSARTGLTRPRLRDALRNLAEAGAITRTTYRHGPGRGGDTIIRVTQIPGRTDRSLESVPTPVFSMLRSGTLPVHLLRTWLRALTVARGRLAITQNLTTFAERWGLSVRTVRNHLRSLLGLELLEQGSTSTLRVPWMRWWGSVPTQPTTQQRRGKNSVRGQGKIPSVNFVPDKPSRQPRPAGATATAQQSVPRETSWPDKPAEKESSSGHGGRSATSAEKRLDRWMDSSEHLAALRGPGRWSVRSVLAKTHRKMPTDQAQAAFLTRVGELLADEPAGIGASVCRGIIRAARVQVIAELKAGTTHPPPCRPRVLVEMDDGVVALLSHGRAAAPAAEPWRYTGPQLEEPDFADPATDPGQIHAWIWSAMSSHADRSGTPTRAAAVVADTIRRRTRTSRFADDIAVSLTLLTQLFNQHNESERTA